MTQLLPPKKEVALALLERSNVDVYLDPRAKGVVVPPQFRKEPRLILKIGLNMPVPIPDLRVDEESMSCTLSFNRSPFYCVVPWSSVFAMVGEDGRGMVWPDDVPQELAVKVVDPGDSPQGPRAVDSPARPGPRALEVAPSPSGSTSTSTSSAGARREGGARRSSKLAEDTSSPAERTSKAAGGKRKKKKEEERPRPVLVSVPPAPAGSPERAPARERTEDARSEAAAEGPRQIRQAPDQRRPPPRDGVSAVPPAPPRTPATPSPRRPPPSDGAARPKRELPPYLRVVK
jgi:stringent starvation protein B